VDNGRRKWLGTERSSALLVENQTHRAPIGVVRHVISQIK
jgi:hypothetical protein